MLKNLKITTKFLAAGILLLIVIAALLVCMDLMCESVSSSLETALSDELYGASSNLINADRDFYQALVADMQMQNGNVDASGDYEENYQQAKDRVSAAADCVSGNSQLYSQYTVQFIFTETGLTEDEDEEGYLSNTMTFEQLQAAFEEAVDSWYQAYNPSTGVGSFDAQEECFDEVRDYLNVMEDFLDAYAQYEIAAIDASTTHKIMLAVLASLIAVIIVGLFTVAVVLRVVKGIKISQKSLLEMADCNLSNAPAVIRGNDEIGQMTRASSKVFENFRNVINLINTTSEKLNGATGRLDVSAREVFNASDEISTAINRIAVKMTEQAGDTENASGQTKILGDIVVSSNQTAESLAGVSEAMSQTTSEGMEMVNRLMEDTESNTKAFGNIFEAIDNMNSSAQNIAEASGLIASIASQTNLLSLNASIEAARAGELGKGFAVVAEEIRHLAEQSADAVSTINEMLQALNENVENASTQRVMVEEAVKVQADSVVRTGEKYRGIVDKIDSINNEVAALERLSSSMDSSCSQVVNVVNNLSDSAADCAASTQETSASAAYVKSSVSDITSISSDMQQLSGELTDILDKFTL